VREAAWRLVESLAPGVALDVPCGTGLFAARLASGGWKVDAGDLDPTAATAAGLRASRVDLEAPLPFPDATYDLVACLEGIEHVERQADLLREAARVTKRGGALVLSTPNVSGRPSRRSLARKGYARFFRPAPEGSPAPFEHEHRHPIDVVRLDALLREAGWRTEAFDGDRGPDGSPSLRRRLLRWFEARAIRRHNPRADLLLAPPVYYGRVLVLRARKEAR
jgi:SAM-dependent methyltransferase